MSGYIGYRKVPTTANASGIWKLNEQAKARKDAIWPLGGDPYFANVSLLLHFDGADNSTTFTDASSNNFTVTKYGDAKISTTQSKFDGSSGYFDGNGDYLSVSDSDAWNFGSNDFTIECWIRPSALPSNGALSNIVTQYNAEVSIAFLFSIYNNNGTYQLLFQPVSGSTQTGIVYNANFQINVWTHVAVVRSGNTIYFFSDGTLLGSTGYTSTINNASSPLLIGARLSGGSPDLYFSGYIDELRITKGVARYTESFTPSNLPF